MAEFLNTRETSKEIKRMIANAKEFVIILSPYIQINEKLKDEIFFQKLNITVVFGKKRMNYNEYMFLIDCKNVTVAYNDNLHAKCYMTEKGCIISSMNLYEYSELNNFEMSVYFDSSEKEYDKIKNEIEFILSKSEIKKYSDNAKKFIASK